MAGVNFPSSFNVTGRFPLDAKYWVDSYSNLSDGEISVGLHRWTLDTGKEYVYQKSGVWKEAAGGEQGEAATVTIGNVTRGNIAKVTNVGTSTNAILDIVLPQGDAGDIPIIDIGSVTTGSIANVVNVGTTDRAILNFVLPKATDGIDGSVGKSIWIAFADDINGTNPTYSPTGKKYISFAQSFTQPVLGAFNSWTKVQAVDGANGQSVWIAYSAFSNGSGASFVLSSVHKYVSILTSPTQPLLSDFSTWVLFKGQDGGPAGNSAYETWLELGNSGTEQDFLDSLQGNNGASAYQTWLDLGNTGTEQDFIDSLGGNGNSTPYTLPAATSLIRGGLRVGSTLNITNTDILNANSQVQNSLVPSTVLAPSVDVMQARILEVIKAKAILYKTDGSVLIFTDPSTALLQAVGDGNEVLQVIGSFPTLNITKSINCDFTNATFTDTNPNTGVVLGYGQSGLTIRITGGKFYGRLAICQGSYAPNHLYLDNANLGFSGSFFQPYAAATGSTYRDENIIANSTIRAISFNQNINGGPQAIYFKNCYFDASLTSSGESLFYGSMKANSLITMHNCTANIPSTVDVSKAYVSGTTNTTYAGFILQADCLATKVLPSFQSNNMIDGWRVLVSANPFVVASPEYRYPQGTIVTPTQLTAPTGLSFTASSGVVNWNTVTNNSGYTIQYSTSSTFASGNLTQDAGANTTTFTLTGLTTNTTYYVRILTKGTGNYTNSNYSSSVNDTTPSTPAETVTITNVVAS